MQPINSNNELENENTLYCGGSGSGKTAAVQRLGRILETDQVAFWDPHHDYTEFRGRVVRRYTSFVSFAKAIAAGRKTRQGFKIALTVPESRKNFLQFCEIVKAFGNGRHAKRFHLVHEEVPQVTDTVSKEKSVYGWLLSVGRKFGFINHSIGQRVVEMSKTTLSMSRYKWIGAQESRADAERMSKESDIPVNDILALKPLDYYLKSPGIGNVQKGRLTFN
ncbi:hypothetical protein [Neptunicella sp. SCSIO 80796]|uniref:hypothetical protein n=1 Tax=Neptunicella plasticusilytica TaxID=3117012 RepID=UPI003A4D6B4F